MISRRRISILLAAGLALSCLGPAFAATAKKKAKKKGYDYDNSRYKAYGALTDPEPRTYRFDANGNPVPPPGSKKTAKKSKKKKSDDAACDSADACTAGSNESDAQPPRSEGSSPDAAASASASAEGD